MTDKRGQLPYNWRPMDQFGKDQGTGLPSKYGKKKGGFSDLTPSKPAQKGKPPTKMC